MKLNSNTKNWVLAAIAILGMASCSQQTIPGQDPNNGDKKFLTVHFTVDNKNYVKAVHGLRGEDNQAGNTTDPSKTTDPVKLSSGYILFVSGSATDDNLRDLAKTSSVTKVLELTSTGTSDKDHVAISDLISDTGESKNDTINDVPSESSQIIILGNTAEKTADAFKPVPGVTLKSVLEKEMDATKQNSGATEKGFSIEKASMVGMQTINWTIDKKDPNKKSGAANIVLVPLVSRIEIAKIGNNPDPSKATLSDYTLRGIYMDSIPKTAEIGGIYFNSDGAKINPEDILLAKSTSDFDPATGMYKTYNSSLSDYIDWKTTATATIGKKVDADPNGPSYTPAEKPVWAYNLYSGYEYYKHKTDGSSDDDTGNHTPLMKMPYIILNIGNPDPTPADGNTNRFVFYKKFTTGEGKTELTSMEPGKIYYFSEIDFSVDQSHPDPTPVKVPVDVTVTQMKWTTTPVDPPAPSN